MIPIKKVCLLIFAFLALANQQRTLADDTTIKPKAPIGFYHVFSIDQPNKPCIVAQLSAYLSTPNNNGSYLALANGTVDATSHCGKNVEPSKLVIEYDSDVLLNLTIIRNPSFSMGKIDGQSKIDISISEITGHFKIDNQLYQFVNNDSVVEQFKTTRANHYYKCDSEQSIALATKPALNVSLVISNFAYEAYRDQMASAGNSSNDFYGEPEECSQDTSYHIRNWLLVVVAVCVLVMLSIAFLTLIVCCFHRCL